MVILAPRDLKRYLHTHPDTMLIDLRDRQAFAQSHLTGAVNVPYDSLPKIKNSLPVHMPLVFYCKRGGSAMAAARALAEEGWETAAVIGSYEDIWRLTETVLGYKI